MAVSHWKHLPLKKEWVVVVVIVIIIIAAFTASGDYIIDHVISHNPIPTSNQSGSGEVSEVVQEVGRLMVLPNETPTLATVSDQTKLANQPFFAHAQNGDKVLIYTQAKKAILYRPSIDKIIEVAPIVIPAPTDIKTNTPITSSSSATITPTPVMQNVKVDILNGTTITGLTKQVQTVLDAKTPGVKVVDRSDAQSSTYTHTMVVVVNPQAKSVAQKIATAVNGKISPLPVGEISPNGVDIVIIAGTDFGK